MPQPRTHRPATLARVTDALGVSRMTVSNAYNRPRPALARAARARARHRAGARLPRPEPGRPHAVARRDRRDRAVLDLALTDALRDPATVELLHGVAAGCEQRALGLTLVPRIAGRDAALIQSALVDGFILYSAPEADERLAAVRERHVPYVLVDFPPSPASAPSTSTTAEARARSPSASPASATATSGSCCRSRSPAPPRRRPRRRRCGICTPPASAAGARGSAASTGAPSRSPPRPAATARRTAGGREAARPAGSPDRDPRALRTSSRSACSTRPPSAGSTSRTALGHRVRRRARGQAGSLTTV